MGKVDNTQVGRDAIHDTLAESHGVIHDAEIGHEDDGWRRLHGGCLRHERSREAGDHEKPEAGHSGERSGRRL